MSLLTKIIISEIIVAIFLWVNVLAFLDKEDRIFVFLAYTASAVLFSIPPTLLYIIWSAS